MKLSTIWTIPAMSLRERFARTGEWALLKIAHHIPRRLAYWVLIDTGGRHLANDVVPDVTFMTVLERAGKDGGER